MAEGSLRGEAEAEECRQEQDEEGMEGCLTNNVLRRGMKKLRGRKRELYKQSIKEEDSISLNTACFVMTSSP